ncbi:MAG: hypothetical protein WC824_15650 [Bacteroidota bacterium]
MKIIDSALFIVFIVILTLKIIGVEPVNAWSWWWIFSPALAGIGFLVLIFMGSFGIELGKVFSYKRSKKAERKYQRILDEMGDEEAQKK